ncbi:MAG: HD domain-containing protein [Desulfobacterales bacterium]|jgi:putative hydrolase of HD superfamily|nr:HD domain-containing protein [Desulfobacteraceae bacterium]MDD3992482.1 HD domain-containing protein [Desulfobacteraceae bacterium]MDY0312334.1 HD domain-containing protein [Desulfobacterales bacterium]
MTRLDRQMEFLVEIDKLKQVARQTLLIDGERRENSAEHSWHIAVLAPLLVEYSPDPAIDLGRVMEMALIHDIVEIDAGDTYCYDPEAGLDKAERETAAAVRLFGLLPEDQGRRFMTLWEEFEARQSSAARFAAALDRIQPLVHNFMTAGRQWRNHGVRSDQVRARMRPVREGAPRLWRFAESLIDQSVARGYLEPGGDDLTRTFPAVAEEEFLNH